jgi:hypothetical protein
VPGIAPMNGALTNFRSQDASRNTT